jgi:hypothetical protein
MSYLVELTYFKPRGKYYGNGSYTSQKELIQDIFTEVSELRDSKALPGIRGDEWFILIEVPTHPNAHPFLVLPQSLATFVRDFR